jgi:hypothetical protein
MTRKQRNELRAIMDRINQNAGLAYNLAWESAKGKTEKAALGDIEDLIVSLRCDVTDCQNFLDELRESEPCEA